MPASSQSAKTEKSYTARFKSVNEDGTGTAVFATLDVIDKDGDVTIPGAFGEQTVKLVGAHDWSAPNIGMAKIREVGSEAIADFKFYLDMDSAREWYKSVLANHKNGVPQEYSYGFRVEDSGSAEKDGKMVRELRKLQVNEVSFVLAGAGEGTRTVDIKAADAADTCTWTDTDTLPDAKPAKSVDLDAGLGTGIETKGIYIDGFPGSFEDLQNRVYQAVHAHFGDRTDDDLYTQVLATYPGRACVCVSDWNPSGGPTKTYYDVDWTRDEEGEIYITARREVELTVTMTPVDMGFEMRSTQARVNRVVDLCRKEGRTLSEASRKRLSKLAASLDDLGSIRDDCAKEIRAMLDETDPAAPKSDDLAVLAAVSLSRSALALAHADAGTRTQ